MSERTTFYQPTSTNRYGSIPSDLLISSTVFIYSSSDGRKQVQSHYRKNATPSSYPSISVRSPPPPPLLLPDATHPESSGPQSGVHLQLFLHNLPFESLRTSALTTLQLFSQLALLQGVMGLRSEYLGPLLKPQQERSPVSLLFRRQSLLKPWRTPRME